MTTTHTKFAVIIINVVFCIRLACRHNYRLMQILSIDKILSDENSLGGGGKTFQIYFGCKKSISKKISATI